MINEEGSWIERLMRAFQQVADEEEINDVTGRGVRKMESLVGRIPSGLQRLWEDLGLMLRMLADYGRGEYRGVPWQTLCMIAFAVAYFVMPLDALPDWIPVGGYLDDATVIGYVIKKVHEELEVYRAWRSREDNTIDVCCN
ncbi:MAG TPA: YkvA family protein [Candidatus Hydrogenedentes bacterium]|nr:YkvA family protein [Candidatus Hydrogenedentota bacterium]HPC15992.1 YkvA family protein [Candidatus Hydrogenedentota bacterium]HRT19946.1 YkvA family protein [Candidatus Hydrogenedentota bacterium]HRT64624.1 YkvA family protein [Candidatus Hydrogenedentota bacterium]